jgi:hypothetical protein
MKTRWIFKRKPCFKKQGFFRKSHLDIRCRGSKLLRAFTTSLEPILSKILECCACGAAKNPNARAAQEGKRLGEA